ncbi:DUF2459 domain-containing protein [Candidatus Riflebacteria bacterium]
MLRKILAVLLVIFFFFSLCWVIFFPSPDAKLWPPEKDSFEFLYVVYWDWHTIVIIPEKGRKVFSEWEFAEKLWYLEMKQGITGALRALFQPSKSVIGYEVHLKPYWERHARRKPEKWTFLISRAGKKRIITFLQSIKGTRLNNFSAWYSGKRSYHLFFNCNHFTAHALKNAGLPIRTWWVFWGALLKMQLDRISLLQKELSLSEKEKKILDPISNSGRLELRIFNFFEAIFWNFLALGFFLLSLTSEKDNKVFFFLVGITFVLLGVSDFYEITSGAWWRPWWLLLLKAGCVLSLLVNFVLYEYRHKKKICEEAQTPNLFTGKAYPDIT